MTLCFVPGFVVPGMPYRARAMPTAEPRGGYDNSDDDSSDDGIGDKMIVIMAFSVVGNRGSCSPRSRA